MERPFFGSVTVRHPGHPIGEAGELFRQFLAKKHEAHNIGVVCVEEPFRGKKQNPQTAELLSGLNFMADWFAFVIGAESWEIPIGTWRKHFIGRGDYAKAEARKRSMDECRRRGWHPPDHDAAAACGVLDTMLHMLADAGRYEIPWRDATFMHGVMR